MIKNRCDIWNNKIYKLVFLLILMTDLKRILEQISIESSYNQEETRLCFVPAVRFSNRKEIDKFFALPLEKQVKFAKNKGFYFAFNRYDGLETFPFTYPIIID